ncbi:MAG: hypothetical protein WC208_13785 [Gallionella sp.]|jgi:alpha-tubulin suppressor-like RCC1 family protein
MITIMEELLSFLATPVISTYRTNCGIVGVNGKLYVSDTKNNQAESLVELPLSWTVTSVSYTAYTTAVITCKGNIYVRGDVITKHPLINTGTYPDWTILPFSEPVVSALIGFRSMLILTLSGKVYGIGNNGDGHLGIGGQSWSPDPDGVSKFTLVELPAPCFQLKVRSTSIGAVTVDGSLYTWGHNHSGRLGLGKMIRSPIPIKVDVPNGELVASVEILDSMLVLTVEGNLYNYCSGDLVQVVRLGFCRQMRVTVRSTFTHLTQRYSKGKGLSQTLAVLWNKVILVDEKNNERYTDYVMLDIV